MKVSLIVPFHNESAGVVTFYEALKKTIGQDGKFEILCVDDGSTDDTLKHLRQLQRKDRRIQVIRLSRNFGKEAALAAGLDFATGDCTIIMDGDLQHPVEHIPQMIERWKDGAEMVLMIRTSRDESFAKRVLSELFYKILNKISDTRLIPGENDFRLLDKKVVRELRKLREKARFTKGLFAWVGFEKSIIYYEQPAREFGSPKQNFRALFRLAFNGIFSFSVVPIRLFSLVGALFSLFALGLGTQLLIETLVNGIKVPGYASIVVGIFFLGGIQIMGLGVLGEYVARIFSETKDRPLYVLADHFESADSK